MRRVEATQLGDEELLRPPLECLQTFCFRLEGLAQLKLKIVHQAYAGRGGGLAREVVHERDALLETWEEQGVVALHFG